MMAAVDERLLAPYSLRLRAARPEDAPALARACVALLESPAHREELGQRAREVARSRYRLQDAAAAYEAVYRSIVRGG